MEGKASFGSLLDEVLPRYDFNEVHRTVVPADPSRAYEALKAVSVGEIRLLEPLIGVRRLPALIRHGRVERSERSAPALDEFLRAGFLVLAERPPDEFVFGAVGRFWSLTSNQPLRTVRTREDFAAFAEPGYVKVALNFALTPAETGTHLTTETRIAGTDELATARFRRYWIVIRLPSGAIRRSWLRAVRRRVERG